MSAVELPPHDPRLPARLGNGNLWPPAAGALQATLRFITGTADGRAALAAARRAGPGEWRLGFQALRETKTAGLRVITEIDLFQLWPRSLPDGDGPGPEVKAAGVALEVKDGTWPSAAVTARNRPGIPVVVPCSICRRPAAALVGGGLRGSGSQAERLICSECVRKIHEALDQHLATLDPADLGAVEELEMTIEQEYERARASENAFEMTSDGTLVRESDVDPTTGRAWQRGRRQAGMGRP